MTAWLEEFHEALGYLRDEQSVLIDLAHAFRATGNSTVADKLDDVADNIRLAGKQISSSIDSMVNTQVKRSQEAIGNTFVALMDQVIKNDHPLAGQ